MMGKVLKFLKENILLVVFVLIVLAILTLLLGVVSSSPQQETAFVYQIR